MNAGLILWGGAMGVLLLSPVVRRLLRSTRDARVEPSGPKPIPLSPAEKEKVEEWVRLWRREPHRRLAVLPHITFTPLDHSGFAYATISGIPPAHREGLNAARGAPCAICGGPLEGSEVLPYNLHMHLRSGMHYGIGTMAHVACFEACPETDEPAGVPSGP